MGMLWGSGMLIPGWVVWLFVWRSGWLHYFKVTPTVVEKEKVRLVFIFSSVINFFAQGKSVFLSWSERVSFGDQLGVD